MPTALCALGDGGVELFTDVIDAAGRPVAHVPALAFESHDRGFLPNQLIARITFTPADAGRYRLSARFEPSEGMVQADLVARPAATRSTLMLGRRCDALDLLPSGLMLCGAEGALYLFRGATGVGQTVAAEAFGAEGATVWTVADGGVHRFLDQGGPTPLSETGSVALGLQGPNVSLIPRAEAMLAVTPSEAVKVVLDGGQPVVVARVPLMDARPGVLADDALDRVVVELGGALCLVPMDGGAVSECLLQTVSLGADRTGLWMGNAAAPVLEHLRFGPAGLLRTSSAIPGLRSANAPHFESTPVFRLQAPALPSAPALDADGLRAETYPLPDGFALMPSAQHLVRAQDAAGTQLLFTR